MASPAKNTRATIIPGIRYRDARKATDFLCDAFGFEKHAVYEDGGRVAELSFGNGMIMLGELRDTEFGRNLTQPEEIRRRGDADAVNLIVDDINAHYQCAKAAGAVIVIDIKDEDYGGRDYNCRDPEGHIWNFGNYDPWNRRRLREGLDRVTRCEKLDPPPAPPSLYSAGPTFPFQGEEPAVRRLVPSLQRGAVATAVARAHIAEGPPFGGPSIASPRCRG